MKTLIVEDDFLVRALLTTLLARCGECHVAVNGKEALEVIESAFDEK
jgi:two-component system chemotaxis response regulator CheY